MGKPYSLDLRERIFNYIAAGHSRRDAARVFGVSPSTAVRLAAMGYALWYAALPGLSAAGAASVQLSVPVITALAGAFVLDEVLTLRLGMASATVLGGIALVVLGHGRVR